MATAATAIEVGSANWVQRAHKGLELGKPLRLVVKGPEALTTWEAIRRAQPADGVVPLALPAVVVITAIVVVGVIAVIGMGTLAAVCLYGMHKGYRIKARHKVNGPFPFDDELSFELTPP